jgi:hypothetical protein
LSGDLTVINDDIVDALLSIVGSDAPENVRSQAAISLGPVLEHADTGGFEDFEDVDLTEPVVDKARDTLHELYLDAGVPQTVRRRILEASVRAPEGWHRDAIRAAYASRDEAWRLTAVFCMRYVRGFDDQILDEVNSADPDIRYEAVLAAGTWAVDGAWPTVVGLVSSKHTHKDLLLAAIEAVACIRPELAAEVLDDLLDSEDEEIGEAVEGALAMAEELSDEDDALDEGAEDAEGR